MSKVSQSGSFGELVEPATLKIERRLPGTLDRVWSYLTDGKLRSKWLAAGEMEQKTGTSFELVWRNDELTEPAGKKPEGFSEEHRMKSRVVEIEPPKKLVFTWGDSGEVSIELKQIEDQVLLTLVHRRLADRNQTLMVGAGWHAHLDILVALLSGRSLQPFWDSWVELKGEYDRRVPA